MWSMLRIFSQSKSLISFPTSLVGCKTGAVSQMIINWPHLITAFIFYRVFNFADIVHTYCWCNPRIITTEQSFTWYCSCYCPAFSGRICVKETDYIWMTQVTSNLVTQGLEFSGDSTLFFLRITSEFIQMTVSL